MAKFELTSAEAVKKVRDLIEAMNELSKTVVSFGENTKGSMESTEKALSSLTETTKKIKGELDTIEDSEKKIADSKLARSKKIVAQGNAEYALVQKGAKARESEAKEIIAANDKKINSMFKVAAVRKRVAKEEATAINKAAKESENAAKETIAANDKKINSMFKAQKVAKDTARKEEAALKKVRDGLSKTNEAYLKNVKAKEKSKSSTTSLITSMRTLVGWYYSLRAAVSIVKNIYELAKSFDSLKFTMDKVIKSGDSVAGTWSFLTATAKAYGAELVSLTRRYIKFYAAARESGLSLKQAQNIFETFTKVGGVLALQTDELSGVFLALEQMLSKGKITTEELRRQLGERLPGAVGIMATALNVTVAELDKMLKKGEVISKDVLPDFAKAVEAAYGLESVTKVNTLAAAQNNLTTQWQLFAKSITKEGSSVSNFFKSVLGTVKEAAEMLTYLSESQQGKVDTRVAKETSPEELLFNTEAFKRVEKEQKGFIDRYNKAGKDIAEAQKEILRLGTIGQGGGKGGAIDKLEESIQKNTQIRLATTKTVAIEEKKLANERYDSVLKEYETAKKTFDKGEEIIQAYEKADKELGYFKKPVGDLADWYELALEKREEKTNRLVQATIKLNNVVKVRGREDEEITPSPDNEDKEKGVKDSFRKNSPMVERLKNAIKVSEETIKLDKDTLDEQELLAESNAASRKEIARLMYLDDVAAAEGHKEKILTAKAKMDSAITDSEIKLSADLEDIKSNREKREQDALDRELTSNRTAMNKEIAAEYEKYALLDEAAQKNKDNQELLKKNINNITIGYLEKQLDIYRKLGLEGTEAFSKIEKKIGELKTTTDSSDITVWIKNQIEGLQVLGNLFSELANLSNAFTEQRIQDLEKEQETLDDAHERDMERLNESTERSIEEASLSTLTAEEKAERVEGINKSAALQEKLLSDEKVKREDHIEKEKRKAQRKQAVVDKAAALSNIAINTAIGYTKALAQGGAVLGIPLANLVLALGVAQAATVLATPLPAYAEGGVHDKDGKMLINDHKSGRQEYINRNGNILTTTKKNAVVDGKKGDVIYKDYQSMANDLGYDVDLESAKRGVIGSSNMFNPSKLVIVQDNKDIKESIAKGIQKGFKNGVVNNIINFSGEYSGYLKNKEQ